MEERCNERFMEPLLPRLDRLHALMEYIDKKNKHPMSRWGVSPIEKRCMPLGLALEEARVKGSVLDRIALLEHRLIQLSLEMESSSVSSSSIVYTCESPSLRKDAIKRQQSDDCFHSFDETNPDQQEDTQHEVNIKNHNPQVNEVEKKVASLGMENRAADAREPITACKNKKKPRCRKNWPCKRLLGC